MALREDQLPLVLPDTDNFRPRGTPESPLSVIEEWVSTTDPVGGGPARRETSTMPQVGSLVEPFLIPVSTTACMCHLLHAPAI